MTVAATPRRAGPFPGNDVTTTLPFSFKAFSEDDVRVDLTDVNSVTTTLTLTSDYTLTLNVDQESDPGGEVELAVPIATGEIAVVLGSTPYTQEADLPSGGRFNDEVIEQALDRLAFQTQQLAEGLSRAASVPTTAGDAEDLNTAVAVLVANIDELNIVVDNIADLVALADDIADVSLVAANIAAVLAAPGAADAAAASAAAAAASAASIALPLPTTSGGSGANYASVAALFNGIKQDASETSTGVVEKLTTAEAQTGTDDTRYHSAATMKAAQIQHGTAVTLTNQTSVDFTGIPAWAKRITITFMGVSLNGTSNLVLLLGDSGGMETTGYLGSVAIQVDAGAIIVANNSASTLLTVGNAAAYLYHGQVILTSVGTGNRWVMSHIFGLEGTARIVYGAGSKQLSAALTQLRVTASNGTDQMDAGILNINYE